jgi:glutamate/tyrosine decarboxylase-like PLP-dependent enzyme
MSVRKSTEEESLDPEDWKELRELGHRMLDDMFDLHEGAREGSVWQPMPEEVRGRFSGPVPWKGMPASAVYDEFKEYVVPFGMGNYRPRFWGWVMGNGTPLGMLADMLASGLNPNMAGGDHASGLVEEQVLEWCRQLFQFPPKSSGLLVSGGSVANLVGLAVARHVGSGFDIRAEGLGKATTQMVMYGSAEMHSSIHKAVELLGLGRENLRHVPVDTNLRMDVTALEAMIEEDLASGLKPICIIATAGTTNTGAIDPLRPIAEIRDRYGLWLHVDGAFGALAYLSPSLRPKLNGLELADSLAFDLHKWVYLPFEIGCALVRDRELHYRTFAFRPGYLAHTTRGLGAGNQWLSDYGIQLTRAFRALKAWMAFKTHGLERIGRVIEQNVHQAKYLKNEVEQSRQLELLAPVDLNIVCFRYISEGATEESLDSLNEEILYRLHESGAAVPSGTHINGRYALRCSVTNHRSKLEDFDFLLRQVLRIGNELTSGD